MVTIEFPPTSSVADWVNTVELSDEDDGSPIWGAVPNDLAITLTITREGETTPAMISTTFATAEANGVIELSIPATEMKKLAPETHEAANRYRMFARLETGGSSAQPFIGILTVERGA